MLETPDAPRFRDRRIPDFAAARAASANVSAPCRYRKEFAGFQVCQATMRVAIVTGRDCGRCPVPDTLERVDCFFLRARVNLAPAPEVTWTCGATDDIVEPDDPSDCDECLRDARRSRHQL